MINCLAIDDEFLALEVIDTYSQRLPYLHLIQTCTSALEALSILSQTDIDLLFLDIDMPDLSGLDFLRSLRKPPLIIFTTAYSHYALEGFDADAVDYLLKPIAFDRFLKATQKAQLRLSDNKPSANGYFFVKSDHKNVRIDFEAILFIEGRKDYIRIHTVDQTIDTLLTINTLLEKLPVTNFVRVHRSFVVALNKITAIERNVIFVGTLKIQIGDLYREAFMKRIS